jgi:septum formation protein
VQPAQVTELSRLEDESPGALVLENARRKARAVLAETSRGLVLGADTVVVADGRLLGKPGGEDAAREMLRRLSGRSHEVYTGLALGRAETGEWAEGVARTVVWFKELLEQEIEAYVSRWGPLDKAGAYGIQEAAALFVERIEGCYTNVVGLPLGLLRDLIRRLGRIPLVDV